jgi:hypothetical protein
MGEASDILMMVKCDKLREGISEICPAVRKHLTICGESLLEAILQFQSPGRTTIFASNCGLKGAVLKYSNPITMILS